MGNVIPIQRAASIRQCRRMHETEDLVIAQVQLWFAWARVVNRIMWGA